MRRTFSLLFAASLLLVSLCLGCSVSVDVPPSSRGNAQVIDTDTLNLRSCPSTDCSVLTVLRRGEKLKVLDYHNSWAKVWFPPMKMEGWVGSQYLRYY